MPPASCKGRSASRAFEPFLLDGVTGSGKTEVYFEARRRSDRARAGRALVLLPEIALTEPFLRAVSRPVRRASRSRGIRACVSRSAAARGARSPAGEALVTVGARSALFLPYANLGLIVVDEAHETSFKQEEGVHYHARDVAVMRAQVRGCPVVLASRHPRDRNPAQVELGPLSRTEAARPASAPRQMPTIAAIDLIAEPPAARPLDRADAWSRAIEETLDAGEQALLFLNRRGYAPLTLCRTCGHRFQCPNCTAWMVEHRLIAPPRLPSLRPCDADAARTAPNAAPRTALVACGPGVERIADEVAALFPEARTAIVTSDTIWSPARAAEFVGADGGAATSTSSSARSW